MLWCFGAANFKVDTQVSLQAVQINEADLEPSTKSVKVRALRHEHCTTVWNIAL